LIEVEYILEGSTVVDQVFHKSLSDMKLFFNREDINIIKCQCLQEKEFLSYISETNRIVNKNKRAESRQMQATTAIELKTIQHESANHDELSATTDVSNYCNFIASIVVIIDQEVSASFSDVAPSVAAPITAATDQQHSNDSIPANSFSLHPFENVEFEFEDI